MCALLAVPTQSETILRTQLVLGLHYTGSRPNVKGNLGLPTIPDATLTSRTSALSTNADQAAEGQGMAAHVKDHKEYAGDVRICAYYSALHTLLQCLNLPGTRPVFPATFVPSPPHPSPLPPAGEGGRSSPWGVCNQRGIDARVY